MEPSVNYAHVELTDEQLAEEKQLYGSLARAVHDLADASLRSTVAPGTISEVQAEVERLTARLREQQIPGSFGVSLDSSGRLRNYGNAVVGVRNPVAPPLTVERSDEGRAWSSFHLGALYEGPPGMVHGGAAALVLDQLLGEAAAAAGSPGMTGTLSLRYVQNTPLGDCSGEAWVDRVEGVKTIVKGELRRADGETTVRAEGVFILPRWARATLAEGEQKPPRFE